MSWVVIDDDNTEINPSANNYGNWLKITSNPCSLIHFLISFYYYASGPSISVVKQYFEVQVYDVFVMRGNTAIFKCQIPSFVADHVDIIEWTSTENQTFEHSDDYG